MAIGKVHKEQHDREVEKLKEQTPLEFTPDGKRIVYEIEDGLHHVKTFVNKYEMGLLGKNKSIPMGFKRLTKFIGIRRQVYYLVGGFTGSGKTTLVDDAFVLNPGEWFLNDCRDQNLDFKVLYFSMERSKDFKIARWLSRKIFMEEKVIIPIGHILGWDEVPTIYEQELINKYLPVVNRFLEKIVTIYEGPTNPTGIYKKVKEFAMNRGHEEEVVVKRKDGTSYEKKLYIADNPYEIVLIIVDTINLTKPEGEYIYENDKKKLVKFLNDKETLDKASEYLRWARDYLGYSPIPISQFNRSISNPIRLKNGDVQPQLEDFKGSGDTQDDAEIVLALFDPMRYKVDDIYGYNLAKLKEGINDKNPGAKKYRQLSILKNSYGADDVGVGLGYQPIVGLFKELPYPDAMTDELYEEVINDKYFRRVRNDS